MKLNSITLKNFKKHRDLTIEFGDITEISGPNKAGKTSIYDAFLWCLFGRDSLGQADFDLHTDGDLDLIPAVTVTLDGIEYHKEVHQGAPQKRCSINGVPKKVREYEQEIKAAVNEDRFRMLTDVGHVLGLTQDQQRGLLTGLGQPEGVQGFDGLLDSLNGRTMDEYRKACADEKKRTKTELDQITPRIDEIKRELTDDAGDLTVTQLRKKDLLNELQNLHADLNTIQAKQSERDQAQDAIANLKGELRTREAELANDTRRIQEYLDEKSQRLMHRFTDHRDIDRQIQGKKDELWQTKDALQRSQDQLQSCREQWTSLNSEQVAEPGYQTGCPTCGQALPADQVEEAKAKAMTLYADLCNKKKARLDEITDTGNCLMEKITKGQQIIDKLDADVVKLGAQKEQVLAAAAKHDREIKARIAELDALIDADEKVKPEDDKVWQGIQARIDEIPLGEDVSGQIQIITQSMEATQADLNGVNQVLNTWERQERDRQRIKELKKQKKDLRKRLLELESILADIRNYKLTHSAMIEQSVNEMFEHVHWSLFRTLKSGEQEPCCIANLVEGDNLVREKNWSGGQRILAGLDIINTLSKHYGEVVPLFIDNYESYHLGMQAPGQEIRMIVNKTRKSLKIEDKS